MLFILRFKQSLHLFKNQMGLLLSLIAPLYFGIISFIYALNQSYLVQDDARLHIIWLERWIDPQLFPNDVIANYYLTIAPIGFKFLYWIACQMGIEPMAIARILPLILAIITTIYVYKAVLQIVPLPAAAFCSTLVLNQNIWLKDDLISAAPRAFIYPLFAAFLYYLTLYQNQQGSLSGQNLKAIQFCPGAAYSCILIIGLQGLFYPQLMLISIAILSVRLVYWQGGSLRCSTHRQDYVIWGISLVLGCILLTLFSTTISSQVGATLTAAQMQAMPEFALHGRREYFGVAPLKFMFAGASGLRLPLFPPIILMGLGLPILLRLRLPVVRFVTKKIIILWQIAIASIGLFLLAHLTFPALYLPSRYTFYSLRIVLAIATGLVLAILLDLGDRWWRTKRQSGQGLTGLERLWVGGVGVVAIAVISVPAIPALFLDCHGWVIGQHPAIYQFLARQPPQTLIASLDPEADNLPAFAHRSVVVSDTLALPYHPSFYRQMERRISDLIRAQYSPNPTDLQAVIQTYGINFWMVNRRFLQPEYLRHQNWILYRTIRDQMEEAIAQLEQGLIPVMGQRLEQCTVASSQSLVLLDATCIGRDPE